jgi:hypothetical protein
MESDGDLVVGGLDVVGDYSEGAMVLGRGRRHRAVRVPTPKWMNAATSQGVSRPQEELDYLPFDGTSFVNAGESLALFGVAGLIIARPQRPFRGERLVLTAVDASGNDVSHLININPAIYVGAVQVGASQGGMPIAAFAPNSFGVRLSWPAAGQGTDVKIFLVALVVPTTTTIFVSGGVFGRAMR